MAINLTNNAIEMICTGEYQADGDFKPIVQVADLKLLTRGATERERYRILISDGVHIQQGLLAIQNNDLVLSGRLQQGSIIELSQFAGVAVQNRKIIIIVYLKVIVEKCEQIGDPRQYEQAPDSLTKSRSPMDQPGITTGDYQSYGCASLSSGSSTGKRVKMEITLTNNAIAMICSGEYQGNHDLKPIVQVADLKLITRGATERESYRMEISDGVHIQQGLLAIQNNDLVHSGRLQKGSIVELTEFLGQLVQNRKIIIVIDLKVIVEKCEKIGDPTHYKQAPDSLTKSQSPMDQPGITTGDNQSYGCASLSSGSSPGKRVKVEIPLTNNAITMICSGEYQGDHDLTPIVQVADLKLITSAASKIERYRMVISDGVHIHKQVILASHKSDLVHSGRLQKGSIVELSQFASGPVQHQKFIIILDLKVIVEKCEQIGDPRQYEQAPDSLTKSRSPMDQPGITTGDYQSYGCASLSSSPSLGKRVKMATNLTNNAIEMICSGEYHGDHDLKPIVQVADLKLLTRGATGTERYRIVISDGVHIQQGLLAIQNNDLVLSGRLQQGSIIELSQFAGVAVQNRKIIIIIDLNVIVEKCEQIGDPRHYVQAPGGPTIQSPSSLDLPGITTGD